MGLYIKSVRGGNINWLDSTPGAAQAREIPHTRAFWNDGHLYIAMPDEWSDYLLGKAPPPWDIEDPICDWPMPSPMEDPDLYTFFEL